MQAQILFMNVSNKTRINTDLFHILFIDSLTNFIVKYLEMATGDIHFILFFDSFFIFDSFLMHSRLSETHLEGLPL